MRFKYEPLMDTIKRRIREEDEKGRRVTEVLLTPREWSDFKTEHLTPRSYSSYELAVAQMPVNFSYEVPPIGPPSLDIRRVTIRQE